jgi:hypothetical protein
MSNSQIVSGGNPIPAGDLVATDQETILGTGSAYDPLRVAGAVGGSYQATTNATVGAILPGMALTPAVSLTFHPIAARANAADHAHVQGIATVGNQDSQAITNQFTGVVTLTTAQWDAVVTGQSGGLTAGAWYYLSSATAGFLTTTAPSVGGTFKTLVGLAISPTELQLQLGEPFVN